MALNSIGQNTPDIKKLLKKGGLGADGDNQQKKVDGNGFSESKTYSFGGSKGNLQAGSVSRAGAGADGSTNSVPSGGVGSGGNVFTMIKKGTQILKDGKESLSKTNEQNSQSQQAGENYDSQISNFLSGMDDNISNINKNTQNTLSENKKVDSTSNDFKSNKIAIGSAAAKSAEAGTTIEGLHERQTQILEEVGTILQDLGIEGDFETIDEALELKAEYDEGLQEELNSILEKNGVKPEEKPDSQKPAGGKGAEQSGQEGGAVSSASDSISAVGTAPSKISAASSAGKSVLGGAGIHAAGQKGSGMIGAKVASDGVGKSSNVNGKAGAIRSGAQSVGEKLQSAGAAGTGGLLSGAGEGAISAGGKAGEEAPVDETENNDEADKTEENEEKTENSDDGCKTKDPKEKEIREKIAKSGEAGAALGALGDENSEIGEQLGDAVTVQEGAEEQIRVGLRNNGAGMKDASGSENNYESLMDATELELKSEEEKKGATDDTIREQAIEGGVCVAGGIAAGFLAKNILTPTSHIESSLSAEEKFLGDLAVLNNNPVMASYHFHNKVVFDTLSTGTKILGATTAVAAVGLAGTGAYLIKRSYDNNKVKNKGEVEANKAYNRQTKEFNSANKSLHNLMNDMKDLNAKYSNRKIPKPTSGKGSGATGSSTTGVQGSSGSQST